LTDPQEVVELGLADALEDQICLIEWPELLGDMTPETALDIRLEVVPNAHLATLTYGDHWRTRMRGIATDA
jgi:tRNA threonylcarbamoyladenosine biosynthesis protein TsaE